jgi:YVTN family beta-propeller protein
MGIEFRMLGPLELSADGRALPLGSPKQRALLALLLVHANETLSRDRLIEELWAEAAPATVESAFHSYLSRLRRLLDAAGAGGLLVRQAHGYRLQVEPDQLDVTRFEQLVEKGSEALALGKAELAAERLRQALALWRGPALADLQSERFAITAGARLEDERLSALEQRLEADLALARHRQLIGELEKLVAEHPYRERLRAQLMLALYRSGRQAEALRGYQQARRTLANELGLEPSHELRELEQAILRQDPTLATKPSVTLPLESEPEPALPPTSVSPSREERRIVTVPFTGRLASRRRLLAASVAVAVIAAALAAILATRGGNAQATAVAANSVGLIDARGKRLRGQVEVDAAPTSVAFGHGALWVTNAYANTVSRIDPETGRVVQTIAVGNSPSGIAIGGGAVWVANHEDGTVSWINPASNTEVKRIRVGNGPTAIAYGYRSVWVTNSDDRTMSRIDPNTGNVIGKTRTDAVGRGIAIGGGSVWVTDESTRTVVQIDPESGRVTGKATVGSGPAGIVYGERAVWVANQLDGTVSKIDPTTLTPRATIPVAGSPSALAFRDGILWVSAEFGQRIVRIDTRTGDKSVVTVGNRPKGLAAVPDGVWVAVQASGSGRRGGRLVVVGSGFPSIDPGLANHANSFTALGVAYDGLTAFRRVGGSEGTQLVPSLAASVPEPTDGGRSYTFRIRAGIRYSDGSLLRARDFRRALERMLALESTLLGGSPLMKVVGAPSCAPGRPCDLSRGMIVNGPDSLTVRLSAPEPRFLHSLAQLVPVPPGTPPLDVGTKPIPSTGPYTIESYVPARQLTLVRNSHFRSWSQAARPNGYPDEIAWRIVVRREEAVRKVINGKADIFLFNVPPDRLGELAARYPRRLHLIPQRATSYVFLNTRRAPFDDIRVRRALNYAADREKMADLHGGPAVAQPTCQTVPPTVPGYRRYCPYTIDPDASGDWKAPDLAKARQLVAASGTKGDKVVVWTFPPFAKEARYFALLLRRLGYRAQLKEFRDSGPYFTALDRTPNVQAGFAAWLGINVATDVFAILSCHYPSNYARFCDPQLDAQVRRLAAVQASDPAAGAALAKRIDREIVDQAPWVPLFTPRLADLTSNRVGNYQPNTYASITVLLDQLWIR